MARPKSDGLSYFPFDVDFFSDKKIKSLRAHFGTDGIALYIYCLCEIYRNSYFVEVDGDFVDCTAADLGLTVDKTRQIMKFFCKRSLFDDTLFTADTILTAKSVQRRYQEARKGSKRDIFVDAKLWLLEKVESLGFIKVRPVSDFSQKNNDFSEKNTDNSEIYYTKESKENKRKGKERKEERSAPPAPPSPNNLRNDLVNRYGEQNVTAYEQRYRDWQNRKGISGGNIYQTISRWLEEDGVTKPPSRLPGSSINMNDILDDLRRQYTDDSEVHNDK